MYTFIIIITILSGASIADTTRIKRHDQTWIWPKEPDEMESTKSTEGIQTFNQVTTPNPNEVENPCKRLPPERPNFKKAGRRISEAKCMEYLWDTKARVITEKNGADCSKYLLELPDGRRPSFAIGGRDTIPGEFPHMVKVAAASALLLDTPKGQFGQQRDAQMHLFGALGWRTVSNTWIFKCGSSLISEKYMLTAAHCSKSPPDSNLQSTTAEIVRLGDKNILDFPPRLNAKMFDKKILRIINHPLYKSPKKYYDIALIELEEPVFFTKYMMPACLWTNPSTTNIGKATLTGWGVIETVHKTTSPELQAAVVDVLDSSVCDQLLKNHCNRHWCGMQEHQVCAGKLAGGVDACQGDSGGPLQVKIPLPASTNQSMHYVIGVTSFGIGCARENLPGIYTRVSSFVDWIESVVWPDDL